MTLVVTGYKAYGVEADEPLTKKFIQRMEIKGTGANTDVTYDLGTYAGTFWTATGGSTAGAAALIAITSINTKANAFLRVGGLGLTGKAVQSSSGGNLVTKFLSAASAGGAAAEVYVVTGLLATDTILSVSAQVAGSLGRPSILTVAGTVGAGSATPTATVTGLQTSATDTILAVTQDVKGANSLPLLGYNTQAANALGLVFSADPGANGTIKVAVSRVATTDTFNPVSWGTQVDNALTVTYGANPGTGAKVLVSVLRASTAVVTGNYTVALDGTNTKLPNLLFITGNAPTTFDWLLEWELPDGVDPVATQSP